MQAQALRDCAGLAQSLEDRFVEADEELDVGLIAHARKLADDLRRRGAGGGPEGGSSAATTTIRNRLLFDVTRHEGMPASRR